MFLIYVVFLRIVGDLLEHDITNDYLRTCDTFDTAFNENLI